LLDFQRAREEFTRENVQVIAASADPREEAEKTVERYGLTFPVGYGLIPREVSELTGAFYHAEENYLHATGFLIGMDRKIKNAVYSSRSIGRLVAKDCLNFIKG
jgi:peroxiredoxin